MRRGHSSSLSPQENSADFRTNVGVVNTGSGTCTATIRLFKAGGAAYGDPITVSVVDNRTGDPTTVPVIVP